MIGIKSTLAVAAAIVLFTSAGTVHALNGSDEANGRRAAGQAASVTVAQAAAQPSTSSVKRSHATLAEAVRLAEQRTQGRAQKVELDRDNGIYYYKVKTVAEDGSAKVYVDFKTGNVDRIDTRGFFDRVGDMFDSDDRRKNEALLRALKATQVTLSEAIDAAEKDTGGRAIKATQKDRYGTMYFQVSLIVGQTKQQVEVDAATATAKVVAVSASKKKHDDDDDD
jgi:uncharacterized membrane protein YkoI